MALDVLATAALIVHLGGNPESVTSYGHNVLASNMGSSRDSLEDGDGRISLISSDGKLVQENFLPLAGDAVLDSPLGIAVSGDALYVADVRRVVGFSLITKKKIFESRVPFEGIEYLNDVTDVGNNRLLVTATNIKRSFIVDLGTGQWTEFMPDKEFRYTNGAAFDNKTQILYLADNRDNKLQDDNGRLMAFDMSSQEPHLIWELSFGRFIDGIAVLDDGRLMITDWGDDKLNGRIHFVVAKSGAYLSYLDPEGKGLADAHYQPQTDTLLMAAMEDGDIRLLPSPFH